jgi:hypothetical protein
MAEKSEEKMRAEKRDKKEKRYRIMCKIWNKKRRRDASQTSYIILHKYI